MTRPQPPGDVLAYYSAGTEPSRLDSGIGALELERTQELLVRILPDGAAVADVGGGDGRYAQWLARRGHRVEFVEPVALHLELARRRAGDPPRFAAHEGDARALPLGDASVDAVLLLGPLYHLGERGDRLGALREAARVCRPGGVLAAAAISRLAGLVDSVRRGRIDDDILRNVHDEVRGGRRIPPERRRSPFPDAYFHLPAELAAEVAESGWRLDAIYGIEGPAALVAPENALWEDADGRERLAQVARIFEREPHALVLSPHLLAVATRPASTAGRR